MKIQKKFLLILGLTVVLPAAAMLFAAAIGKQAPVHTGHSSQKTSAKYHCPMHPQVVSHRPRHFPIFFF